jgi:hypothetical protein
MSTGCPSFLVSISITTQKAVQRYKLANSTKRHQYALARSLFNVDNMFCPVLLLIVGHISANISNRPNSVFPHIGLTPPACP